MEMEDEWVGMGLDGKGEGMGVHGKGKRMGGKQSRGIGWNAN